MRTGFSGIEFYILESVNDAGGDIGSCLRSYEKWTKFSSKNKVREEDLREIEKLDPSKKYWVTLERTAGSGKSFNRALYSNGSYIIPSGKKYTKYKIVFCGNIIKWD
jgi:hypothetical protein